MGRLCPENFQRFRQSMPGKLDMTFAGAEANVAASIAMLGGKVKRPEGYDSSKTRVAVTVGMMTTGYDCPDILNLCLMRPIFSPTDFIQIKGRGTRKHNFSEQIVDVVGE